jgi:MarR family transcriptional regulator, 2-MHQ and catechol-resistance regulon repressor
MATKAQVEVDTSGVHVFLVMWKATRVLEQHGHRSIAGLEMGLSDFGVLEALLHKGPLAIKDLGAKVLLTSGSITTAIDRLERRGLVERWDDENDRRSRIVRLTSLGRQMIRKAFAEHRIAMEQAISGLSVEDRGRLIDLLRRLGQSAEEQLKVQKKVGATKRRKEK